MAQHVSPGVFTKIIDLSEYVQNVPSTIGFIPIITEQGPDNQLVFTNSRDYFLDFGEPNISYTGRNFGQGPYVADSFLRQSSALYVIRCLPEDATWATLLLQTDGTANIDVVSVASINNDAERDALVTTTLNPNNCLVFYGVGRGEFYNDFQVKISQHVNPQKAGIYVLDILKKQEEPDDQGNDQYGVIDTFEVSFDYRAKDDSGESAFIEDVVNKYSRYIKCVANADVCLTQNDAGADWSAPFEAAIDPINLENGSSGSFFDVDGRFDEAATGGNSPMSVMTKAYDGTLVKTDGQLLNDVLNTEDYYFTIVFDGGYPLDVKKNGISNLVMSRLDCVAIVDNGDNINVTDSIAARQSAAWNTKYVALYEPYSVIYDKYTGRDISITPVYHMANIIPYTDNVAELWYAPAGFNRATITQIKSLRFSPLLDERDQLYLQQINPIVKFNVGYTVWGQLTTQKRPSALQDLNIVRLVLYIKRALEQFTKFYVFELNDSQTWSKVKTEVNKFLKVIQNKRGLYDYSVQVGATDYELKAKQFHVDVTLNPTRVVEQIYLNFFIK